jgi:hypothetical protein
LQIARGDFGALGQCILRQFFAHTLTTHVRAKRLDSLPFSLGNCHDILHRFCTMNMNDTYIVKKISILLVIAHESRCNWLTVRENHDMNGEHHQFSENQDAHGWASDFTVCLQNNRPLNGRQRKIIASAKSSRLLSHAAFALTVTP